MADMVFAHWPLVGGSAAAGLGLWLGWRNPTLLLLFALAFLAVRPELLWGGSRVGYAWGPHHTLLVLALAANALRYGVRLLGGWPILALLATFGLGLAFGDLHPKLTLPFMLMSLGILALPFTFTQVVLAPGSRRAYALVIMTAPLVSVAIGALLQFTGTHTGMTLQAWAADYFRLEGATGNAGVFAALAFGGFAVATHEATRPGRPYAAPIAIVDLALVILSGTRMAMLASGVFLASYVALSPDLRALLRRHRITALIGFGAVAAIVLLYWPILEIRMFSGDRGQFQFSQRGEVWSFFLREWSLSPLFGRGFGAGFIAADHAIQAALPTPHNEYLHLLVVGGAAGFLLVAAAIASWLRQLTKVISTNDRPFLLSICVSLAVYCLTDNLLIYSSALSIYASLAFLLVRPAAAPAAHVRAADQSWFYVSPAYEHDPR